jgi:hypothetical protein
MATLIRPTPSGGTKTRQDKRPFFTLHKPSNSIMAWETKTTKMAVVAFTRQADIHTMGSMIEYHRENTLEWPDFRNLTFTAGPIKKQLSILDVYEWSDFDELKVFCVKHYFDLIVVNKINDSFNIKGAIYNLSIPEEYHIPHLEYLLNKNDTY